MSAGSRELASRVVLAVFSGTGNTLVAARALSDELSQLGRDVSLVAMDAREPFSLPPDASLGLALPVACFSTYPTVWRFLDGLPAGGGRGAFLLATMGGLSMGMEGPLRRAAERRGYEPLGAKILVMPGNYGNKTIPAERNERRVTAALCAARRYARALADGCAQWGGGVPLLSSFWAHLAHTPWPWRSFYWAFPLAVDRERCTGCGLCRDLCPERNVTMEGGRAVIGRGCQSCQRCVAFCPANAVAVPGKPAEPYRGCAAEDLLSLLR